MKARYLLVIVLVMFTTLLKANIGDTIVYNGVLYIVTTEDSINSDYGVKLQLIYEQDYVTIPEAVPYNNIEYKVTNIRISFNDNDSTRSIFEEGDSINPTHFTKIDFSTATHILSDSFNCPVNNMYYVYNTIIDTLILPPNVGRIPRVYTNYWTDTSVYPDYMNPYTARSSTPYLYGVKRIFTSTNKKIESLIPACYEGFNYIDFLLEVDISSIDMDSLSYITSYGSYGEGIFNQNYHMEKVRLPSNLKHIGEMSFLCTYNLTDIILPESLISIDDGAFGFSTSLDSLYIPRNVENISFTAFSATHNMKKYIVDPDNPYYKDISGVLYSKSGKAIHTIPMYQETERYILPDTVDSIIGSIYAYDCYGSTLYSNFNIVPVGWNSDPSYSLENLPVLKNIRVNENLSYLCPLAFADTPFEKIENFENCNIVSIIPYGCFAGSFITDTIKMPPELTTIGQYAFYNTPNLKNIDLSYKLLSNIGSDAFGSSGIECLDLSKQTRLTLIPFGMCAHSYSLRKVILPSSINTINPAAFHTCTALDTIMVNALEPPLVYRAYNSEGEEIGPAFSNVPTSTCKLLVPAISISKYQSASIWEEFYNIEADTSICVITVGVSEEDMGTVQIASEDIEQAVYPKGEAVLISAKRSIDCQFVEWSDGNKSSSRSVNLDTDTTLIAIFERDLTYNYRLTIYTSDSDLGSVKAESSQYNYTYGDTAIMSATANSNARFVQWEDGVYDNPRKVVITQDTAFTAVFVVDGNHLLTVESSDTEKGSVYVEDDKVYYYYGDTARIGATAGVAAKFTGWNDGVLDNPREVLITQDTLFTASFTMDNTSYIVTVGSSDTQQGTASGSGFYKINEVISIEASPRSGYLFDMWNDSIVDNPLTVVVTQDTTFIASFVVIETAVDNIEEDLVQVYASDMCIYIDGEFSRVEVFTMLGQLYYSGSLNKIAVIEKGIYIVKVDNSTTKIVVQ
ncbi:MAG: leucine-rich repeat domain-containing protein [bacterium]